MNENGAPFLIMLRNLYVVLCNFMYLCTFYQSSEISPRQTHHKPDSLYRKDKGFVPIYLFHGQCFAKAISIKRTLPKSKHFFGPDDVRFREISL